MTKGNMDTPSTNGGITAPAMAAIVGAMSMCTSSRQSNRKNKKGEGEKGRRGEGEKGRRGEGEKVRGGEGERVKVEGRERILFAFICTVILGGMPGPRMKNGTRMSVSYLQCCQSMFETIKTN